MAKIIAVVNQKGGCSKTTVVANLGVGLSMEGKKVCVIDADPQGSLTASLGLCEEDAKWNDPSHGSPIMVEDTRQTLATVMMDIINEEPYDPTACIISHEEGIDLVPANIELSGLEVSLANVMSREMILKEYVDQLRDFYDYILIDCMPSLGVMTIKLSRKYKVDKNMPVSPGGLDHGLITGYRVNRFSDFTFSIYPFEK